MEEYLQGGWESISSSEREQGIVGEDGLLVVDFLCAICRGLGRLEDDPYVGLLDMIGREE